MQVAVATARVSLTVVLEKPDKPRVKVRDRQTVGRCELKSNSPDSAVFRIQRELLHRICDAQDFRSCAVTAKVMAFEVGQHIRAKTVIDSKAAEQIKAFSCLRCNV